MNNSIMCPKCRHTDSAISWDANTRLCLGLIDDIEEHIENPEDPRYLPIMVTLILWQKLKRSIAAPSVVK